MFGSQRARVFPHDNRTEKKVFTAPQFWDTAERAALHARILAQPEGFVFVDAGANVGIYSLAVRAMCHTAGKPLTCLAIEPDPTNAARLATNITLNTATDITHRATALGATSGEVQFRTGALGNRGEAQIVSEASTSTITVPLRPLLDLVTEAGLPRIDALKMDIEGFEEPVLTAFFRTAPAHLMPQTIIIETVHGTCDVSARLEEAGYTRTARHGINGIYDLVRASNCLTSRSQRDQLRIAESATP